MFVPRKPTRFAREARAALEKMAASLPEGVPLPTLGKLGEAFALHPSTVLRILRDLVQEGICWQSPAGKFFPASSRKNGLRGLPICFLGRELWNWSRLYQEILEGVSEVAAANQSTLAVLTARSLVRQNFPDQLPRFASRAKQFKELSALLAAAPKQCAGFILDHLWAPEVIQAATWPGGTRIQLLGGAGAGTETVRVDFQKGAACVAKYARSIGVRKILIAELFRGDPAIDASVAILENELAKFDFTVRKILLLPHKPLPTYASLIVCPEDNLASALADKIISPRQHLIATQGTGILRSPHARLRYDYRRLGRAAASFILTGEKPACFRPSLIFGLIG